MSCHYCPTPEIHARFAWNGMTRYSYDEVAAAVSRREEAQAERQAVENEALALTAAYDDILRTVLPEYLIPLVKAMEWGTNLNDSLQSGVGHGSSESFPVAKWDAETKRIQNYTKRLRRALEKAQN